MKRRSFLAATAGAAAGAAAAPLIGGGAASAQSALNTISVDLAASQGQFPFRLGAQLGATPQSWNYGAATYAAMDALRLQRVRVWQRFIRLWNPQTNQPAYGNAFVYHDTYASRADTVLLNWQTDYDPLVTSGEWTEADLFEEQLAILAEFKRRCPKIEFIEAENEKLWTVADAPGYYRMYRFIYRLVNQLNTLGLPGPRLQVGGPTLDVFSELRLGAFLDLYRADTNSAKRLDFLTYHQYLINTTGSGDWTLLKERPAVVAGERAAVDRLLASRSLPRVPVLITEVGIFPGLRESHLGLEPDLHIQAAALASLHYYYAGQRDIIPFDWTMDHPENDRKDLFLSTATGEPRPYYNALRALSMLPTTRYRATSDALSANGLGVYGLAGADAGRVAVMSWNYQWTRTTARDSRIVISNFPTRFRTSNVQVTRYRIPTDIHSGPLLPVERFVIPPRTAGTYFAQTLPMLPNELRLLELTPVA